MSSRTASIPVLQHQSSPQSVPQEPPSYRAASPPLARVETAASTKTGTTMPPPYAPPPAGRVHGRDSGMSFGDKLVRPELYIKFIRERKEKKQAREAARNTV